MNGKFGGDFTITKERHDPLTKSNILLIRLTVIMIDKIGWFYRFCRNYGR